MHDAMVEWVTMAAQCTALYPPTHSTNIPKGNDHFMLFVPERPCIMCLIENEIRVILMTHAYEFLFPFRRQAPRVYETVPWQCAHIWNMTAEPGSAIAEQPANRSRPGPTFLFPTAKLNGSGIVSIFTPCFSGAKHCWVGHRQPEPEPVATTSASYGYGRTL